MSWQDYVDKSLLGTGLVSKAAIHGHNGGAWATSAGFAVQPAEVTTLVGAFADSSSLAMSGIKLGGVKYMYLRGDAGRSIYGRKGGDAGCVIVKTNQSVVIGIYENGIQGGSCTTVVEKLADYLIGLGY